MNLKVSSSVNFKIYFLILNYREIWILSLLFIFYQTNGDISFVKRRYFILMRTRIQIINISKRFTEFSWHKNNLGFERKKFFFYNFLDPNPWICPHISADPGGQHTVDFKHWMKRRHLINLFTWQHWDQLPLLRMNSSLL